MPITRRIRLPDTTDGLHFLMALRVQRFKSIDGVVPHCLFPDCQCEKVEAIVEFIQYGWWDDEHTLVLYCARCNRASGYVYKTTDPETEGSEVVQMTESEA